MATARDIVTAALRKIQVCPVGEAPAAEDAEQGLGELNRMIAFWAAGDVDIEQPSLTLEESLVVDAKFHDGIVLQLALRLASDYSRPATFARDAEYAWRLIEANFKTLPTATIDEGLLDLPSVLNYGARAY